MHALFGKTRGLGIGQAHPRNGQSWILTREAPRVRFERQSYGNKPGVIRFGPVSISSALVGCENASKCHDNGDNSHVAIEF
jgi:hypothetical protein